MPMPSADARSPLDRGLVPLIALIALLAHAASLANQFAFDDRPVLLLNHVLGGPFDLRALFGNDLRGLPPGSGAGTWRPLVGALFWVEWHLGGGRPLLFHLGNLCAHAFSSVTLALALRTHTRQPRLALAAGALFAILAVNTEAVASVLGVADVLAAGFGFLAWHLLGSGGPMRLAGAALSFFAAMLCKESALILPLWVFAADRMLATDEKPAPRPTRYLGLCAAAVAALALRRLAYGGFGTVLVTYNNNPLYGESLPVRAWTAMRLFLMALRLVLFPLNLSADYSFAELLPDRHLALEPLAGAGALALVICAAVFLRRRDRVAATAAVLVLVPWLVVSNLVTLLPTIFAERLLYLPAAGAALALCRLAQWLLERGRRVLVVSLAVLFAAGNLALAFTGDRAWRDELHLFASTVEASPRSARAWNNYGAALLSAGDLARAEPALARAIEIAPLFAQPHSLLGQVLARTGRRVEAYAELHRAVELASDDADAVYNLALFLARHGQQREAAELLGPRVAAHPELTRERELLRSFEDRRH